MTDKPLLDKHYNEKELERLTGLTPKFWKDHRRIGHTPPFMKTGPSTAKYKWRDVKEWLEKNPWTHKLVQPK
jgi:hypothetical protein